ncbi:MAG: polysaccharide deacetylase family protein [Candidatus Omnitrophica bacterium]|nr:polysaccharide deacetylase family protein [Candidatus Omnitrophota bacterium]
MKQILKKILNFLLLCAGVSPLCFYLNYCRKKQIVFLLYHRIREPRDCYEPAVSAVHFQKHLKFIRKYFEVIGVDEAVGKLRRAEPLRRSCAVITFDDGYRDNYDPGYAILKKEQLPAVIFLALAGIDKKEPMWTSYVEALFELTSKHELVCANLPGRKSFSMQTPVLRKAACFEIKSQMKRVSDCRRNEILEDLIRILEVEIPETHEMFSQMLDWEQIRQMDAGSLITFGSHTISHRMLANLNRDEIVSELADSKHRLEEKLGHPVDYISYPGNSYDQQVVDLAQQSGYAAAFAVDQGISQPQDSLFKIKRIHIENGGVSDFIAELSFALSGIRKILKRLRVTK